MSSTFWSSSSSSTHTLFRPIEYSGIVTATDNFAESSVIARGQFGNVYAGHITLDASLVHVAIKRADPKLSLSPEVFMGEVKRLSKLHHCNLVSSVIGYCIHEQEKMLVYEYLPNIGTFHDLLHNHDSAAAAQHVSWLRRLQICLDVARGLDYLHEADFVHGDIRSSHILLNECGVAKVAGLGMQKTCSWHSVFAHFKHVTIRGVFNSGYLDPLILTTGQITKESDVYSFGVLLLEVLYRKLPVFIYEDEKIPPMNIVVWAQDLIKRGGGNYLKHITDPDIWAEISPKCLKKFVRIALECVNDLFVARPTMAEVIASLEEVLLLQEKFMNGLDNFSRPERSFRFLLPAVRSCFCPRYL